MTNLTESVIVKSVESRNFAGGDINAAFAHHTDASLRIRRLKGVDVMHERRLGRHFEVPNDRIALSAQVD